MNRPNSLAMINQIATDSDTKSENAADTLGVLLRELIDYAGLFPPASLSMSQSVANYAVYAESASSWILGRLILPVARLGEFAQSFAALTVPSTPQKSQKWRLSVLLGSDAVADIERIHEFNDRTASAGKTAVVDSIEVKVSSLEDIGLLAQTIPSEFATYFEIPCFNCADGIAAVADCGRRAKIRTGGETADKFPASESVIDFIRLCAASNVPFKATAGLHHPLRSIHRFTYQPDSPSGAMHGFLNVFLATAFLRAGLDRDLAIQLLEERLLESFQFDADGTHWRQHCVTVSEIADTRKGLALSFGSCSFTEPIDDLKLLGML